MKFNNGHWLLQPGVEAVYPTTVVDVQVEEHSLVVTTFGREVRSRNEMIEGPVITIRFTSPAPEVIRVQVTHHKGRQERRPSFDLDYAQSNPSAACGRDEQMAWLTAGTLTVQVPVQGPWRMSFLRDGEEITTSEPQALAMMTVDGTSYLRDQLSLQP